MTKITGPWADWDSPLNGQEVFFAVEEYPDRREATKELRRLLEETGGFEDDLTPGPAKKRTVRICVETCEDVCEDSDHQQMVEVWVYTPRVRRRRLPSPPKIMRCPECLLLCVASGRNGKTYIHGKWNGHKVDRCPGSHQPALDPKKSKPVRA